MQHAGAAAILALAALAGPAAAAEKEIAIEAFANACPAALLAPDTLPAALERASLTQIVDIPLGNAHTVGYATTDDDVNVSLSTQEFADATRQYCVVAAFDTFTADDVEAIRKRLEADPLVGLLDGVSIPLPYNSTQAHLKRPGADPLVTFVLTATPSTGTLSMEKWTLKR